VGAGGQGCLAGGVGALSSGAGGSAPSGPSAAFRFTFDADSEGFTLNDSAGGLVDVDAGMPAALDWDGTVGAAHAGSLRVAATFTDPGQFVLASLTVSPIIDATGKILQMWVAVDPFGCGVNVTALAQLEASTTANFQGVTGAVTPLSPGKWTLLTLDLGSQPAPFDPSQLIQVGVQFSTGAGADGGVSTGPIHATFHVDDVSDGSAGPAPPELSHTFDRSIQSYSIYAPSFPDAGVVPTLAFDSTVGDPSPGSLEAEVPFTAYGQSISVQVNLWPPAEVAGKTIHAKVMLDAAAGVTFPAGFVQLHAGGLGDNDAAVGPQATLAAGQWTDLILDTSTAGVASFHPAGALTQIGVQIGTGPGGGGSFPAIGPLGFHIDSIVAQ
jgi:hypothetical protein